MNWIGTSVSAATNQCTHLFTYFHVPAVEVTEGRNDLRYLPLSCTGPVRSTSFTPPITISDKWPLASKHSAATPAAGARLRAAYVLTSNWWRRDCIRTAGERTQELGHARRQRETLDKNLGPGKATGKPMNTSKRGSGRASSGSGIPQHRQAPGGCRSQLHFYALRWFSEVRGACVNPTRLESTPVHRKARCLRRGRTTAASRFSRTSKDPDAIRERRTAARTNAEVFHTPLAQGFTEVIQHVTILRGSNSRRELLLSGNLSESFGKSPVKRRPDLLHHTAARGDRCKRPPSSDVTCS
ncbi:hypothetical protein BKA62DRAFT_794728 [Auriculariales sp. MPI-PUGE-AT-0066]|nr:hypothetical protein BKA62DRAFT_794728 [Auriculariales sp. MPI-PUGE-AT-0066]